MVNFGRSNFFRKGLSRFENRVEKQIWSVELGEPGSMTKRALWPRLELCDASVIAWGEAQRFGVRSLTTIDFPEWLFPLFCGSRYGMTQLNVFSIWKCTKGTPAIVNGSGVSIIQPLCSSMGRLRRLASVCSRLIPMRWASHSMA